MRFDDQKPSWESQYSVEQAAECQVRSFLKSICLMPFVWFQIVPGMHVYELKSLFSKLVLWMACICHHSEARRGAWPWKFIFYPRFLVMQTSTFVLRLHWGRSSGFSAGSSNTISYMWLLMELKCHHWGCCWTASWKKKVIEYWLLSSRPLHPYGGMCVPVS